MLTEEHPNDGEQTERFYSSTSQFLKCSAEYYSICLFFGLWNFFGKIDMVCLTDSTIKLLYHKSATIGKVGCDDLFRSALSLGYLSVFELHDREGGA